MTTREEPLVEIDLTRRRSQKTAPLFRKIEGISVIDLVGNLDFPQWPPHRQLIFILLIFTVKDRGSALHLEPSSVECEGRPASPILKLFYEIEGELRELVPAPWELWPLMLREFDAMTGLASFRHRLAYRLHHGVSKIDGQPRPRREGRFLLRVGDETITVKLVAWPSDRGERIILTFDPVSANLSERARAGMRQLTMLVETETRSYLSRSEPDPPRKPSGVLPEGKMTNDAPELDTGAGSESSASDETA